MDDALSINENVPNSRHGECVSYSFAAEIAAGNMRRDLDDKLRMLRSLSLPASNTAPGRMITRKKRRRYFRDLVFAG